MGKFIDLTGQVYGRLTVLSRAENKSSLTCWYCRCICNTVNIIRGGDLNSGKVQSCGCLNTELRSTRGGITLNPVYQSWLGMVARCTDPSNPSYPSYGAAGITVYAPWVGSFQDFNSYVGPKPTPNHSIDRIENSKGYEPGNVRWATKLEQTLNRSVTVLVEYDGALQPLAVLARLHGLAPKVVNRRVRQSGWSVERALTTPVVQRTAVSAPLGDSTAPCGMP
jgi:hypothetical protein